MDFLETSAPTPSKKPPDDEFRYDRSPRARRGIRAPAPPPLRQRHHRRRHARRSQARHGFITSYIVLVARSSFVSRLRSSNSRVPRLRVSQSRFQSRLAVAMNLLVRVRFRLPRRHSSRAAHAPRARNAREVGDTSTHSTGARAEWIRRSVDTTARRTRVTNRHVWRDGRCRVASRR